MKTGRTVRELAINAGIDPDGLERTIEALNGPALEGDDPQFRRRTTACERANGDPTHKPNPCVSPLDQALYYTIPVSAGVIGTFAGLTTDAQARTLTEAGDPVPGLYAINANIASITGGDYVAGGCMLGPHMSFGYIAAGAIADEPIRMT